MLYTIQCRHRNIRFEISELETLNSICRSIYEHYQIIDVQHYHWYTYYEMPQLLGIKLLRRLQSDRSLTENQVLKSDVLLALHDTEVFTYFHRLMSPMSQFEAIDPNITVLDLKRAIQLQIPYFSDVVELGLFMGQVELNDSFTLVSFPFRPGDVILMVPRARTPKPWEVMSFPFPSPATISALPKSPRTIPKTSEVKTLPPPPMKTGDSGSPIFTPKARTTSRTSTKKVAIQENKREESIQTFDSYIQKIRHEDEEKELLLTLQGNFQRFSNNPNEFYQITLKVKVTSTIQQIKSKVIDKFPTIRNYHLSCYYGLTKLEDTSCIIEVAGGGVESSVVLFVKMSETLSSRIEQIYYRSTSSVTLNTSEVADPAHSSSGDDYYGRIFPSKGSQYQISESVWFLPASCELFIQFLKNPDDYPPFHPIHRHCSRGTHQTSTNYSSAFREVFNINNITLAIETVVGRQQIPLTNETLFEYTFCLPLNLSPRHLFRLLIKYRDFDYTREIIIPIFTLHNALDTLPSSLPSLTGDMMVYDPRFHLFPKKANESNEKIMRLLVRGKHPVIKLLISDNDGEKMRKDMKEIIMINNQEDQEIFELPLLFLHPHDCIVKDIKKKLMMLSFTSSIEDIHLYSSHTNTSKGDELNDLTPFSQLFSENDAIIDVIYHISLADVIISCYYMKTASSPSENRVDIALPSQHTLSRSMHSNLPLLTLPTSFILTIHLSDMIRSITDWKMIHVTLRECKHDITRLVMVYYDQDEVEGKPSLKMKIEMISELEENAFYELQFSYYHLIEGRAREMTIFFKTDTSPQSHSKRPHPLPVSQVTEKKKRGRKRKVVTEKKDDDDGDEDYRDISEGKRKNKSSLGLSSRKLVRRSTRTPKKYDQYLTIHSELDDEEAYNEEVTEKFAWNDDSDSEVDEEVILQTNHNKRKTTASSK